MKRGDPNFCTGVSDSVPFKVESPMTGLKYLQWLCIVLKQQPESTVQS